MITPIEVKNIEFQKSAVGGYKVSEVNIFLDEVSTTIETLYKENAELVRKLQVLAEKIEEYRKDEDSIRNALLTAQRMGDQIMREAKEKSELALKDALEKSESIIASAKEKSSMLLSETDNKVKSLATDTKEKANLIISDAREKSENMLSRVKESCEAETKLYDSLRDRTSEFRSNILEMYKEQIELLKFLPETNVLKTSQKTKTIDESAIIISDVSKDEIIEETKPQTNKIKEADEAIKATPIPNIQISNKTLELEKILITSMVDNTSTIEKDIKQGFKVSISDETINPSASVNAFGTVKFGSDFEVDDDEDEKPNGFGFFKKLVKDKK